MKAFNFDDWFTKELNEQIASRRDALATGNGVNDYRISAHRECTFGAYTRA